MDGPKKLTLPNSFIHDELSKKAYIQLYQLPRKQLMELIDLWLTNKSTLPPLELEDDDDENEDEERADNSGENHSGHGLSPKDRRLISYLRKEFQSPEIRALDKMSLALKVREDYWHDGFNLLQVAQIESTYVLELKRKYSWSYSTLYLGDKPFVPVIEPKSFLRVLQRSIYPLIVGHTYVTEHKPLSLIVVRIQMFEPKIVHGNVVAMAYLKSIYLAFPSSSPYVLHSSTGNETQNGSNRTSLTMILLSLTRSLSIGERPVTFKTSSDLPTKALESLSIIKGTSSRRASSLGAWSIYADGVVDDSPLNQYIGVSRARSKVDSSSSRIVLNEEDDEMTRSSKRRRLAHILFTGQDKDSKEYSSNVSLPMVEVKIREIFEQGSTTSKSSSEDQQESGEEDFKPQFTMRLEGTDVFAGVFKLAVDGTIDVSKMPSWLTGEDGKTTITVTGGRST